MRGLIERLEALIASPNVDLMTQFYDETTRLIAMEESTSPTTKAARMRHPREIALECIDLFVTDTERFERLARHFTQKCAQ
ncbi:hypothetical protein PINS_up009522 [Pythium insidiosum]|nr:hypothetical protein PINS_up009522 [Pythium insidiosum]